MDLMLNEKEILAVSHRCGFVPKHRFGFVHEPTYLPPLTHPQPFPLPSAQRRRAKEPRCCQCALRLVAFACVPNGFSLSLRHSTFELPSTNRGKAGVFRITAACRGSVGLLCCKFILA
jgi:hypothetical protein